MSVVEHTSRHERAPRAPKTRWSRRTFLPALALTYCGFLCFYGLNAGQLYRTESLRAIVAEGFLRSGNWLVPTLYGEPLLTKPPRMYAAIALVSWPFGAVSEWTARLPSALAALGTVVVFGWHFRRQLGRTSGWLAVLLLPLATMWLDKATAAEIDMLQVFWVTAAIVCFLRALEIEEACDLEPVGVVASLAPPGSGGKQLFCVWPAVC